MKQLAEDVKAVLVDGLGESEILRDWDNNEIAEWPDNFKACCAITEGDTNSDEGFTTLLDLDKAWGGNVARFLEAFDEIAV